VTTMTTMTIAGAGERQALRASRLESIQVLRAIAAIGVVFTHAITRIGTAFPDANQHSVLAGSDGQLTAGDAGVDLFFAISGFIMLYVHRDDFGKARAPLNFMIKRIIRIVPIYWSLTTAALIVLMVAPQLFTTHYRGIDLPWIIGSYLFVPIAPPGWNATPVVGVGWTLNFEMFFYVAFAFALFLPRRLALHLIFVGFGGLVAIGVILQPSTPVLGLVTNWLLLDFLMGVAIALWLVARGRLPPAAAFALLLIGAVCLAATILWPPPEEGPLRVLKWGIPTALIVFAMSSINIPEGRVAKPLCILGDASYSIYLFQFFALPAFARVMEAAGADAIAFDVNVVILTVLVTASGFFCWLLLERPLGTVARSWLGHRINVSAKQG
jgi:exopolysaccharide production protein ExoZ